MNVGLNPVRIGLLRFAESQFGTAIHYNGHSQISFSQNDFKSPSMSLLPELALEQWSSEMDDFFKTNVHEKVLNHSRTTRNGHINPLGYPYSHVQPFILNDGRADFNKGYKHQKYGDIDNYDKVLLYCYFNLRGHFHSSKAHFLSESDLLVRYFFNKKPCVIDIGCGPATSALALADAFPGKPFRYFGVDSAKAMQERGDNFLASAKINGILHSDCDFAFYCGWDDVPVRQIPKDHAVLLNFAFFFASESLDDEALTSLAAIVKRIAIGRENRQVIISYTNSIDPRANQKYAEFLELVNVTPKKGRIDEEVRYQNRLNMGGQPKKQLYSHELYRLEFE